MIKKIVWVIRAILYNFVTKFPFPGYIGKPLYISSLRRIAFGKRVRIYPGLRAEIENKKGKIKIGNNVSIGQNFHVVSNDEELIIGNNVVISGNVFVSNCEHSYQKKDVFIFDQPLITKTTKISDNCFIGFGSVIQAGTKLGKNCIVGANSVVKGEFEDNCVIVGAPAKIIKKYNLEKKTWEKI